MVKKICDSYAAMRNADALFDTGGGLREEEGRGRPIAPRRYLEAELRTGFGSFKTRMCWMCWNVRQPRLWSVVHTRTDKDKICPSKSSDSAAACSEMHVAHATDSGSLAMSCKGGGLRFDLSAEERDRPLQVSLMVNVLLSLSAAIIYTP